MPLNARPLLAAAALGLVFLGLNWVWLMYACFPFEIHTFKWQCEAALPFLVLCFLLAGAFYAWLGGRYPLLGGALVSLLILGVGAVTPLLDPWYGQDPVAAAGYAFLLAVVPASIGSFLCSFVRNRRRPIAL